MNYDAKVTIEHVSAMLAFTTKSGEVEELYLGSAKDSNGIPGSCLGELYDYHQCNGEFGDDDLIVVDGKWTFCVLDKIHIAPADDATRQAVMGLTKELPYRVAYSAPDGKSSKSFATIEAAAQYVKDRWQGEDYQDGPHSFHTDYARYQTIGFLLSDVFPSPTCNI